MSDKHREALDELERRRRRARELGGPARVAREHQAGRLTARERIAALVDEGSFMEVGMLATTTAFAPDGSALDKPPAGFVCGLASIDGRPVAVGAEDYTVRAGAATIYLDRVKGGWGGFVEELALEYRIPLVLLLNGVGGDVSNQDQDGHAKLVSGIKVEPAFRLLEEVPVVTAVLGPVAGSSAARAVISHFSVMTRGTGCLFAGGPPLVRRALGLQIDKLALGGAEVHAVRSGSIDNAVDGEPEAFRQIRRFLWYLPRSAYETPPLRPSGDPVDRPCEELLQLLPDNRRQPYRPRQLIDVIFDLASFFEVSPEYGRAVTAGLATLDGIPVGVLASNPWVLGGAVDAAAAEKQTRFVEMCDTFHLPIVYLADVPGLMIGPDAEASGLLRRAARAMQAIHRATVPVITVQVRKGYGLGSQLTSNPNRLGLRFAWPTGEWGDMPIEGGVEAAFRRRIDESPDPDATRRQIEARMLESASMWRTVEAFGVEEVLDPRETRFVLSRWLAVAVGAIRPERKAGPQYRP